MVRALEMQYPTHYDYGCGKEPVPQRPSWIKLVINQFICHLFSIDLRALALMRIGIGIVLLCDVIDKYNWVYAFFSEDGIIPLAIERAERFTSWTWPYLHVRFHNNMFAIHALFWVHIIACVLFILGWKARTMALTMYVLLTCQQSRIEMLGEGADKLMLIHNFWSIFLPIGSYYSINSLLPNSSSSNSSSGIAHKLKTRVTRTFYNKWSPFYPFRYFVPTCLTVTQEKDGEYSTKYYGVGVLVLYMQLAVLYHHAGLFKAGMPWTWDLTAIWQVLNLPHSFTRQRAVIFQYLPSWVLALMTWAVRYTELVGIPACILFFIPCPSAGARKINTLIRTVGCISIILLHFGFNFTLSVGLFPFIGMTGGLCLLPSDTMDYLERKCIYTLKKLFPKLNNCKLLNNTLNTSKAGLLPSSTSRAGGDGGRDQQQQGSIIVPLQSLCGDSTYEPSKGKLITVHFNDTISIQVLLRFKPLTTKVHQEMLSCKCISIDGLPKGCSSESVNIVYSVEGIPTQQHCGDAWSQNWNYNVPVDLDLTMSVTLCADSYKWVSVEKIHIQSISSPDEGTPEELTSNKAVRRPMGKGLWYYPSQHKENWVVALVLTFLWSILMVQLYSTLPGSWLSAGRYQQYTGWLHLNQQWNMFAPNPWTSDGFYKVKGIIRKVSPDSLQNGIIPSKYKDVSGDKEIDLLQFSLHDLTDVPFSTEPMPTFDWPSSHWQKYMTNMDFDFFETYRKYYLRYLCRKWNEKTVFHHQPVYDTTGWMLHHVAVTWTEDWGPIYKGAPKSPRNTVTKFVADCPPVHTGFDDIETHWKRTWVPIQHRYNRYDLEDKNSDGVVIYGLEEPQSTEEGRGILKGKMKKGKKNKKKKAKRPKDHFTV